MENTVEEQDIEILESEEVESEEVEEVVTDEQQAEDEETDETDEDEELVYTFGEDSPPQEDEINEDVPKKLRAEIRERNKRIKELEAKLGETQPKEEVPTLGAKPTLASCDFDDDVYEKSLEEWYLQKKEVEAKQEEIRSRQIQEQNEWAEKLNNYTKQREQIKAPDYEDAESVVMDMFTETQQGLIVQGASNPAALVYALGKNPAKAKELSQIKDPVKFAWEASKLEGSMKTTKRKPASKPEKTVKGSGTLSGTMDKTLDKLREKAAKTGDYSEVHAYKRSLRN